MITTKKHQFINKKATAGQLPIGKNIVTKEIEKGTVNCKVGPKNMRKIP